MLFSDDVRTESGRAFGRELRARIPDARVIYVDPRIAAGMSDEVLKAVDEAKTVVAAVYVIPTRGQGGEYNGYGGCDWYAAAASAGSCSGKDCGGRDGESILGVGFPKD